jgi:hypothetical protein
MCTAYQAPSHRPPVSAASWNATCRSPSGEIQTDNFAVPRGFSGKNNDGDPLQYILIRLCPMLAVSCFLIAVVVGQKSPHGSISSDISELAPEDLMQLKVTSATNKEQSLSTVGAVLYVITREDIASSGANNIPDLLRLVPGVQVAQIDSNQWAIRGRTA